MRVESGPANFDRLYNLGFTLLCLGFSAYFFYDWKIGYPRANHQRARETLARIVADPKRLDRPLPDRPREEDYEALRKTQPRTAREVHARLGRPFEVRPVGEGRRIEYFASTLGMATVPYEGEQVLLREATWQTWHKTAGEIQQQFWCGVIAGLLGLWVLWRTIKAFTLRVTVDESGMTYARRTVPAASITRLTNYNPKGWVDLFFDDRGRERRLRLDNQKVREFDAIIDALCRLKGFPDPRSTSSRLPP